MYKKAQPTPFIGKLVQFASLFGVTPWYSVRQRRLVHKKTFKWYSTILAAAMAGLSLTLLYFRFNFLKRNNGLVTLMDGIIELTVLVKFEVVVLGAAFWHMTRWEQFVDQIFFIHGKVGKTSESLFIKINKITFILGNVLVLGIYTYELITYMKMMADCVYFITTYIFSYVGFVLIILILNFSASIRCGYKHLNYLVWHLNFADRYGSSMDTLGRIKKFFLLLDETVDNFNKLLGFCLLLTLFEGSLNVLMFLLYTIRQSVYGLNYGKENQVAVVNFCYITISMVSRIFNAITSMFIYTKYI